MYAAAAGATSGAPAVAALRARAATGLQLFITLDSGEAIRTAGVPAYVAGYLQAVDAYR